MIIIRETSNLIKDFEYIVEAGINILHNKIMFEDGKFVNKTQPFNMSKDGDIDIYYYFNKVNIVITSNDKTIDALYNILDIVFNTYVVQHPSIKYINIDNDCWKSTNSMIVRESQVELISSAIFNIMILSEQDTDIFFEDAKKSSKVMKSSLHQYNTIMYDALYNGRYMFKDSNVNPNINAKINSNVNVNINIDNSYLINYDKLIYIPQHLSDLFISDICFGSMYGLLRYIKSPLNTLQLRPLKHCPISLQLFSTIIDCDHKDDQKHDITCHLCNQGVHDVYYESLDQKTTYICEYCFIYNLTNNISPIYYRYKSNRTIFDVISSNNDLNNIFNKIDPKIRNLLINLASTDSSHKYKAIDSIFPIITNQITPDHIYFKGTSLF